MNKFSEHENEALGFESKWKEIRSYQTVITQTQGVETHDESSQRVVCSNKEIQASPTHISDSVSLSTEEEKSLSDFLSNISFSVIKELDKNDLSNAMTRFTCLDLDDEEDIKCEPVKSFGVPDFCNGLKCKVSSLSWNCVGRLLAVAYCFQEHSAWCSHEGLINFFNTEKSVPSRSIKTKSCVTCVSMHPHELSLVAVGTYSGDVITYNLHQEELDSLLKSCSPHSSQITQVSWEYTVSTSNKPVLIAASLDGTLSMFNVIAQTKSMTMIKKFVISDTQLSVSPGILCFSFSSILSGTFVASVEGGQVYSCSTVTASLELSDHTKDQLYNPIVSTFDKHPSNVNALSFSKHSTAKDNLFVSSSLEEIRIYDLNSTTPIHVIFCAQACLGVAWSITQPQILFYWGADQSIVVFNVTSKQELSHLNLHQSNLIVTSAAFNSKIPNLMAIGNNMGHAQVSQIPKYFRL